MQLKSIFDENLDSYRLEKRMKRIYIPHITLCTNNNINDELYNLTNKKFKAFTAEIRYIWIYNRKMKLIKEYELN